MSSTMGKSSESGAAAVGMAQAKHPDDLGRCTACREVYEERLLQGGKCSLCQKPAPVVRTAAQQLGYTADDLAGMCRSMLECLCQKAGIRYPLGASRAKLASLLTAAAK